MLVDLVWTGILETGDVYMVNSRGPGLNPGEQPKYTEKVKMNAD